MLIIIYGRVRATDETNSMIETVAATSVIHGPDQIFKIKLLHCTCTQFAIKNCIVASNIK